MFFLIIIIATSADGVSIDHKFSSFLFYCGFVAECTQDSKAREKWQFLCLIYFVIVHRYGMQKKHKIPKWFTSIEEKCIKNTNFSFHDLKTKVEKYYKYYKRKFQIRTKSKKTCSKWIFFLYSFKPFAFLLCFLSIFSLLSHSLLYDRSLWFSNLK